MRRLTTVLAAAGLLLATMQPGLAQEGGEPAGAIAGTVEEALVVVPQPLEGVCVTAYSGAFGMGGPAGTATTAGDGTYVIDGLAPGEYLVGFNQCEEPLAGYAIEWWEDAAGADEATLVTVNAGQTREGVDASLGESGTLSGTITATETDEPLAGTCVTAIGLDVFTFGLTSSGEDGAYDLPNLPEGDYLVIFQDCEEPLTRVTEFFDDVSFFSPTPESPEPTEVHVTEGEETGGIDAALDEGGMIQGELTAAHTRRPIPLTCVGLHEDSANDSGGSTSVFTFSGAGPAAITDRDNPPQELTGEYFFAGVPAGSYDVGFNSCGDDGYETRWYDGHTERSAADRIDIEPGDVEDGVSGVVYATPSIARACAFEQSVVTAGPDGQQEERSSRFEDVSDDNVHQHAIDCVAEYGIAEGTGDGNYEPDRPVRRDQMASFVARTLSVLEVDLPEDPPDAFTDDDGNTHEAAINQLAALGIVSGTGQGRYGPANVVGRGQMTAFLVSAYQEATGLDLFATGDHFGDDDGTTFEREIDLAASAGIASGATPSDYNPGGRVLRDQMASFLARTVDRAFRDVFYERGSLVFTSTVSGESSVSGEGGSDGRASAAGAGAAMRGWTARADGATVLPGVRLDRWIQAPQ